MQVFKNVFSGIILYERFSVLFSGLICICRAGQNITWENLDHFCIMYQI